MKKVMINIDFIDAETGKVRKAGTKVKLTEERVAEIRAVNPDLITVIGTVEEPKEPAEQEEQIEPVTE